MTDEAYKHAKVIEDIIVKKIRQRSVDYPKIYSLSVNNPVGNAQFDMAIDLAAQCIRDFHKSLAVKDAILDIKSQLARWYEWYEIDSKEHLEMQKQLDIILTIVG
jgi:hypothetical protein